MADVWNLESDEPPRHVSCHVNQRQQLESNKHHLYHTISILEPIRYHSRKISGRSSNPKTPSGIQPQHTSQCNLTYHTIIQPKLTTKATIKITELNEVTYIVVIPPNIL